MPKKSTSERSLSISAPVPGADAFTDIEKPAHVASQAATLLLIGSHLRGDIPAMQARLAVTQAAPPSIAPFPAEDLSALEFPTIRVTGDRFRPKELQQISGLRLMAAVRPRKEEVRSAPASVVAAAQNFYTNANSETAAALLETSLRHPNQLVRVAAASSYIDIAVDPQPAIRILEDGLNSKNLLTRDVAAYALAHADPKNPKLAELLRVKKLRSRRKRSRTSTIIHGTWASTGTWWQPGGDFWTYLHENVDPSLYGAADRFGWTGGYSDAARADGGTKLHAWVQEHDLDGLDLFTHSHGGSVAMLANQAGTRVGRMVLLSCPVHWPKYTPQFDLVGQVVSVRVHLDLVILADRGGQKFSDPRIHENVLPIWFDHFATHDPANWDRYNIKAML
ncbi:MAG TPA: hypothetical protein VGV15_23935 [Terriglobales bacterium]|nr:hypothetical protein [Terriglobales bacterium]